MDIDKEFIRAVIRGGKPAVLAAIDRDIDKEFSVGKDGKEKGSYLAGDGKKAWAFLRSHFGNYDEVPSVEAIESSTGIDLSGSMGESHQFFLDEIFKRRLWQLQRHGTKDVSEKLEAKDPNGAAEIWIEINRKIQEEALTVRKVESLLSLGKGVIADYKDAKAGKRGIPTPWSSMDNQTLGWWPEDLILFVGRLGVGKTWTLVICAHKAWMAGHKVLVVSTEMNKMQMARRFFALHLKLPYDEIRRGKLGEFVESKFFQGVEEIMNDQGIDIVAGDFDYSIDNIATVIADIKPNLMCLDGPYLIKNVGKDRHEKVSNTFDDFKKINKRTGIATITNLQFNRSAKTGQSQTIAADNIGITDVAGWNADAAYGLNQTDEMRANWQMGMKGLKIREGTPDEFLINWNHGAMDFSEIGGSPTAPAASGPKSMGSGADSSFAIEEEGFDDVPF
jgi:KaiC/GvpD/RAD55 family RecA-like ATPase